MTEPTDLSLRVQTPTEWVELLSTTHSITYQHPDSDEMEEGLLVAVILDAALDPATTATLKSGQAVELRVKVGTDFVPLWTGKLLSSKVSYPRPVVGEPLAKATRIEVTAMNVIRDLSGPEPRSVHTLDGLRRLLFDGGVDYRVNGTTAPGPGSPLIVAKQDGATLAQQVAITRDTVGGYVWVANDGVLEVADAAQMPTVPAVVFSDQERSPSYSAIDVAYDTTDVLDEVTVEFLRYQTVADQTESVTYGPYRREGATGSAGRTVTFVDDVEDPVAIEAFGRSVLNRHSVAVIRPLSMTLPVKDAAQRAAALAAHQCSLVRVRYGDKVNTNVRVASLEGTIQATPDGVVWSVQYTFDAPDATQQSDPQPTRPPALLLRMESLDEATARVSTLVDGVVVQVEEVQQQTTAAVQTSDQALALAEVIRTELDALAEQVEELDPEGQTEPPASSPGMVVTGLTSALVLRLTDPVAAGARVQYHLSTVAGFEPSALTAVGPPTVAGVYIAEALHDGSPLVAGTTYYARAVAANTVGAAAPGTEASGQLNLDAVRQVVAAELVAGFILAGRVQIGQAYIDADEGLVIPNPDGTKSVLPFDGSPIALVAMVNALSLTVSGTTEFGGLVKLLARQLLADGVSTPGTAPTVTTFWPTIETGVSGVGLVEKIGDPSKWVTLGPRETTANGVVQVFFEIDKATGAALRVSSPITESVTPVVFTAGQDGFYYMLGREGRDWTHVRFDASYARSGSKRVLETPSTMVEPLAIAVMNIEPPRTNGGTDYRLMIFYRNSSSSALVVTEYRLTATAAERTRQLLVQSEWPRLGVADVAVVPGDAGPDRRIAVQTVDGDVYVFAGTSTTDFTHVPDERFPRAMGATIRGLAHDGTRYHALTSLGLLARHGVDPAFAVTVGYTWAGTNGTGGFLETQSSPVTTLAVPRNTGYLATFPSPPEMGETGDQKANRIGMYTAANGATPRRHLVLERGIRAAAPIGVASASSPVAPASNGFAGISAPAMLVPERGLNDAAKMWRLSGSGAGKMGDLVWTAEGVTTYGKATADVPATSPFTSQARVVRSGGFVQLVGSFTRASSFTAAWTPCGAVPVGFRPAVDTELPSTEPRTSTSKYQFRILTTGVVEVWMTAAAAGIPLPINAVWLPA